MSTWISHLRIAEGMLSHLSGLHREAFTFGSLAPDSGLPNADWTMFDPPKEVTHFLSPGEDEGRCRDLQLYSQYLAGLSIEQEPELYSFLLGYFFHLICDNLWSLRLGRRFKEQYKAPFDQDRMGTWRKLKKDWYDLDFKYLRDHPGSLFWTTFLPASNLPSPLPFISSNALHHQMDYIKEWYSTPNDRQLDRKYPYLSESSMTRHVEDNVNALLNIYRKVTSDTARSSASIGGILFPASCVVLYLPAEETMAYKGPLGDAVAE